MAETSTVNRTMRMPETQRLFAHRALTVFATTRPRTTWVATQVQLSVRDGMPRLRETRGAGARRVVTGAVSCGIGARGYALTGF